MSFGELVKGLRIAQKKTLRQFCFEHGHDPSNWSKVERGVNPPPKDERTLARWARHLGLTPGGEAWEEFMVQADVSRGNIPRSVMNDQELVAKLPLFFRTVRGSELTPEQLEDFVDKVRKTHTANGSEG